MEKNIIAETPRLRIREFVPEDVEALYALYQAGDVGYVEPLSNDRDEERKKIENYILYAYRFYGMGFWAVEEKATGALIGRCGNSCPIAALSQSVHDASKHLLGDTERKRLSEKPHACSGKGKSISTFEDLHTYDIIRCVKDLTGTDLSITSLYLYKFSIPYRMGVAHIYKRTIDPACAHILPSRVEFPIIIL